MPPPAVSLSFQPSPSNSILKPLPHVLGFSYCSIPHLELISDSVIYCSEGKKKSYPKLSDFKQQGFISFGSFCFCFFIAKLVNCLVFARDYFWSFKYLIVCLELEDPIWLASYAFVYTGYRLCCLSVLPCDLSSSQLAKLGFLAAGWFPDFKRFSVWCVKA